MPNVTRTTDNADAADDDATVLDASYTESSPDAPAYTTASSPAPTPTTPLSRASILDLARTINSAALGLAACIEQASLNGQVRPAFLDAWRKWHGALAAWSNTFERLPMNLMDAQRTVARQAELLEQWRQGVRAELGPRMGVGAGPVVAQPVAQSAPAPKTAAQGVINSFPWWVKAGLTVGAIYGAYRSSAWLVRQWGAPDDSGSEPRK